MFCEEVVTLPLTNEQLREKFINTYDSYVIDYKESTLLNFSLNCEVVDICNGDCHQLNWETADDTKISNPDDYEVVVCPAPKTLMKYLKEQNNISLYNEVLNGFMGAEK